VETVSGRVTIIVSSNGNELVTIKTRYIGNMRSMTFPKLHGGAPVLNFVDTVDPRIGPDAEDFLGSAPALSAWAEYAGLARNVRVTSAGYLRALELRETLYRVFLDVAHGRSPRPVDLRRIHAAHAEAFGHARLTQDADGFRYAVPASAGVDAILWPILQSAVELLAEPERVKECPGEECGWVFLDTSKNGTRRWCSMSSCGAREKMRRYRARVRS
jgi:predicted RNA-binding Zn ribbon-like protein